MAVSIVFYYLACSAFSVLTEHFFCRRVSRKPCRWSVRSSWTDWSSSGPLGCRLVSWWRKLLRAGIRYKTTTSNPFLKNNFHLWWTKLSYPKKKAFLKLSAWTVPCLGPCVTVPSLHQTTGSSESVHPTGRINMSLGPVLSVHCHPCDSAVTMNMLALKKPSEDGWNRTSIVHHLMP